MTKDKVTTYEKQIIKGIVAMHIERGISLDANYIECLLKDITGNNNCDHRCTVEDYVQTIINRPPTASTARVT